MTATQTQYKAVSRDEWMEARRALLEAEKEFTRKRDELSRRRRELPWEKVEKNYGRMRGQTAMALHALR